MTHLLFILFVATSSVTYSHTCLKPLENEPILTQQDFPWHQTIEQIRDNEKRIEMSGKRLWLRAYQEGSTTYLPIKTVGQKDPVPTEIPQSFIESVTQHIEEAFRLNYVDALTFADMGHSHFFIPQEFYNNEIRPLPVGQKPLLYQKLFHLKDLKILYHTAEQLRFFDENRVFTKDRYSQFRFYTRNLVGQNRVLSPLELIQGFDSPGNAARDYSHSERKYRYWGAGFNISISKQGCFPFMRNGEMKHFDLSLEDIQPAYVEEPVVL